MWSEIPLPTVPGGGQQPVGSIGTVILYHFLSTMDYADRALVPRRRSRAGLLAFQASARSAGAATAPLWLAPDHFLFSRGRVDDYGPALVLLDTGGPGFGVALTDDMAARAGVVPDYTRPRQFFGVQVFPCTVAEASLGTAVRHGVPGIVGPLPSGAGRFGFESIATISHEFLRPLSITFDFTGMTLYLTAGSPDGR